jgi:transcriptional regulator with XRE-family HTH domain
MENKLLKSRVTEIRLARGMSRSELARAADMGMPTLGKYEDIPRRPSALYGPRIARALQVPEHELYAPVGTPIPEPAPNMGSSLPKRVARFAAARRAHWDNIDEAAAALGLSADDLRALEAGAKPLNAEFLWKFVCVSRYPASWIELGSVEDMSGLQAARIAGIASDLIEED